MTPHELLTRYFEGIESAVGALRRAYIEYYGEELLTPTRANLRLRIRFESGRLLDN
jgi:putative IMPACT (imprinted ancient) family translation regulator